MTEDKLKEKLFDRFSMGEKCGGCCMSITGDESVIDIDMLGDDDALMSGVVRAVELLLLDGGAYNQAVLCDRLTFLIKENQARRRSANGEADGSFKPIKRIWKQLKCYRSKRPD